jgi:hypothetical protein
LDKTDQDNGRYEVGNGACNECCWNSAHGDVVNIDTIDKRCSWRCCSSNNTAKYALKTRPCSLGSIANIEFLDHVYFQCSVLA